MRRIRLANLALGDPDDVEIYASAAVYDWTQKPEGRRVVVMIIMFIMMMIL